MTVIAPPPGPRPRHVAIIMDGNGRWATERGLPRSTGHRAGADALRRTLRAAKELGLEFLTVFAFSSENWKRPPEEVAELMRLFRHYLRAEIAELHAENIRLKVIGDRTRLAPDLVTLVANAEALTRHNSAGTFIVALSYGGRDELVHAARSLARDAAAGHLDPEAITAETLSSRLYTDDIPDPDLLIRTSGEQRISNFLLWQLAYAELAFTHKHWPDFAAEDLAQAMAEYGRRDRRFGTVAGGR